MWSDLTRRKTLALAGTTLAAPAFAQAAWPSKPVRFIVPFPPGQSTDIVTRLIAGKLTEVWKQPVIVENRAGRNGIPATAYGKAARPDGYTLMVVTSGTFGVNPSLFRDLPYKPLVDFLPISNIILAPLVIVAHPSFPADSLDDLVELTRRKPRRYSYASAGPGTAQHLAMELFKLRAGLDIVHVPYKGSGPAMADLLKGHVKLMMDNTASALNPIVDGRVKALAVTTARRCPPPLDGIPPVADTLPDFDVAGWSGLAAPTSTPLEIVARVSRDLRALLEDPDMIRQIEQRAAMPAPSSPIQFADFIKREIDTWGELVRSTGTNPRT